ncbi:ATP synthase subunit gamma, mitochondrial-like [Diaphorina citri]|uniref:ATP synthase subunit gamma, mitochondrial-like n=1 Tax=Diaphorina citri TaxID=121845 RepID=A0A3Q0IUN7_DIACI|nr:ATP synthase subunit gamma, mitochondrial-like [Diaphorina citri]
MSGTSSTNAPSMTNQIRVRPNRWKRHKVLVITIGDKSRAILQRLYGNNIILAANEVGRRPPTFLDASKVAQETSKYNFTSGKIIYNKFKSVVSYTTSDLPIFSLASVTAAPKLGVYDSLWKRCVET